MRKGHRISPCCWPPVRRPRAARRNPPTSSESTISTAFHLPAATINEGRIRFWRWAAVSQIDYSRPAGGLLQVQHQMAGNHEPGQAAKTPYFRRCSKPFTAFDSWPMRPLRNSLLHGRYDPGNETRERTPSEFTASAHRIPGSGRPSCFRIGGRRALTPPPLDMDKKPDPVAVDGMIKWLNARQDGGAQEKRWEWTACGCFTHQ